MQKQDRRKRIRACVEIAVIALFCAAILLLDIFSVPFSKDVFRQYLLSKIIQQSLGVGLAGWCLYRLNIRLFERAENLLYLLPCLLVAINNLPWHAYFSGKMQIGRTDGVDILLFIVSSFTTALFEEIVFRGILFALLASLFKNTKKGLWLSFLLSSILFGISHLFNGFSIGGAIQAVYTTLTGGLFAFCLIKTKNLLCSTLVHAVYNICGTLFDAKYGLGGGAGVVFDLGSVLMMAIIGVLVGVFVLYKLYRYPKVEQEELYRRLEVKGEK